MSRDEKKQVGIRTGVSALFRLPTSQCWTQKSTDLIYFTIIRSSFLELHRNGITPYVLVADISTCLLLSNCGRKVDGQSLLLPVLVLLSHCYSVLRPPLPQPAQLIGALH
jgi:hypothetical protein